MPATLPPRVPRFWPLFAVALAVRLAVVILGVVLAARPPNPYSDPRTPREFHDLIAQSALPAVEPWYHFDAGWNARIALHGYAGAKDVGGRLGVAFMPAMPATMAAARALGLDLYVVGLIVANLAGAAGAAVLARVAAKLTGDRATGLRAFVLVNAFPTAFFFSAAYNESFGLLFTALALSAWVDNRPARSAVFAALGSLSRMQGVSVGVAALAGWLCDDRTRRGGKKALIVAIGSFAGFALFLAYLAWAVGDPFAGLKSQVMWGRREFSLWNPWHAIESIYDPQLPHWGEALVALLFVVLGVRAWQRRGAFWGVLTLVPVGLMMMSGTFLSAHRLILAAVPGFIELADLLRNRVLFLLTVAGFAAVQFVLLNRYVHWLFAG